MAELSVPPELECDHPDFDPDAETWQCRICRHQFSLAWSDDDLRFRPVRPVGLVDPDHSCADCRKRINDFIERFGGRGAVRAVGHTGSSAGGGVQPGVNAEAVVRARHAVQAGTGERDPDP